jgi:hypothetical protein
MGKFIINDNLKAHKKNILFFKNLNFNITLCTRIKVFKKFYILQKYLISILHEQDNFSVIPILVIYYNYTLSSYFYGKLKKILFLYFLTVLCKFYIKTTFNYLKCFYLISRADLNINYFNNFIKHPDFVFISINYIRPIIILSRNICTISWYNFFFNNNLKQKFLIFNFFILNKLLLIKIMYIFTQRINYFRIIKLI